jgi:lysozyme family protein
MKSVADIINGILRIETGKYTNDPLDSGGETKWGWTKKSLRAAGWMGEVENLTRTEAFDLYYAKFVMEPGYYDVMMVSDDVGAELVDTAVNMGEYYAGKFLQMCLNAFNDGGYRYPDIAEDGKVGRNTIKALSAFLDHRGAEGERTLLAAMNCLQGARYLELSQNYPKNERFVYGWITHRVKI